MSGWIEIIQAVDLSPEVLVYRYPSSGFADIKMGAQLIVNENQEAVFFRDGKALDVFGPGRHTLTTANIPFLTQLLSLPFGFNSPFKAAVYFISKSVVTDMKWGTPEPVVFRDSELAMVRLRAHGTCTLRVVDSRLFLGKLAATCELVTAGAIETFIRSVIVSKFTDLLGETLKSIFELPAFYEEIGIAMQARVKEDLEKYGIELVNLYVLGVNLPDEVQKIIDERTGMAVIGDMSKYIKYRTTRALEESARNPSGAFASGMGFGAGAGAGVLMGGLIREEMTGGGRYGDNIHGSRQPCSVCTSCGTENNAGAKFCSNCGRPLSSRQCPGCGAGTVPGAKFCSSCGLKLGGHTCSRCNSENPAGGKFCSNCGNPLE